MLNRARASRMLFVQRTFANSYGYIILFWIPFHLVRPKFFEKGATEMRSHCALLPSPIYPQIFDLTLQKEGHLKNYIRTMRCFLHRPDRYRSLRLNVPTSTERPTPFRSVFAKHVLDSTHDFDTVNIELIHPAIKSVCLNKLEIESSQSVSKPCLRIVNHVLWWIQVEKLG